MSLTSRPTPIPVARYYTRALNAAGGIHVRLSPYDARTVDIRFFSSDGLNLSKARERAIENIFFREDFRRVYLDEIGRIEEVAGEAEKRYTDDFIKAINADAISTRISKSSWIMRMVQPQPFCPPCSCGSALT